jgi:hypothetical protein
MKWKRFTELLRVNPLLVSPPKLISDSRSTTPDWVADQDKNAVITPPTRELS